MLQKALDKINKVLSFYNIVVDDVLLADCGERNNRSQGSSILVYHTDRGWYYQILTLNKDLLREALSEYFAIREGINTIEDNGNVFYDAKIIKMKRKKFQFSRTQIYNDHLVATLPSGYNFNFSKNFDNHEIII